jgi:CarboxypepD_reg-like domain/TonB-dependent Receptor Plug Domain
MEILKWFFLKSLVKDFESLQQVIHPKIKTFNMIRSLQIVIFLLVGFSAFSQAQKQVYYQLKGIVKDEMDKVIPGATVSIGYEQMKFSCDVDGSFTVKYKAGTFPMAVSSVGYLAERFAVELKSDTLLYIVLKPVTNQLEQVVISGDRGADNIRKPVGIAQLNTKVLKKIPAAFGETDLLRGLQMLPGVSTVGEASNGINVRGGTTDQNLMLLDETPIFNPTHMFGLFSIFPPDGVARADLYKGNVPSRFGGRASSVLDVTLENPALDSLRVEAGVGMVSSRLLLDIPVVKEKLGFLVTGRAAFTDFLLPLISKKNFENVRANFQETSIKGLFRPNEKNSIFMTGYYSKDFFQTDLLGTIGNINAKFTQNAYSTLNLNLRHFHMFNNKFSLSTGGSYVDYQPSLLLPEKGVDNTVELKSGIFFRQVRSSLDYQDKNHQAKFGVSSAYYRINPGELIPNNSPSVNAIKTNVEYGLESAIFAEDNVKLSPRLAASVGLRYSVFMALGPNNVRQYGEIPILESNITGVTPFEKGAIVKSYGGVEPRIGLRYDLSDKTSIKIAYNLMRQYIQTVTNTTTPLPTSRWKTSDTYIRPQVSQSGSVGWFHNFKDNIYEMSVESYYRLTSNIIEYKQGANFLLKEYPETELLSGDNRSYGLETMVAKKKGDWTGWLSYTYSKSLNKVAGINNGSLFPSNYDRPHALNAFASLNYNKFHTFSFTFVFSTGRPFSSPLGSFDFQGVSYPYYPGRNNDRLPAYHRLDFSWNILSTVKENKRWKNYWTFSVYNLYGRSNPYSIYFNNQKGVLKSYALKVFAAPIPSLAYNLQLR